ncbi:MAG: FapA family protein [Pseudothermotoga sp.]
MKVLRANSVEELLSILEKQYGPDWYNKITVRISEIADQVEATVEPVQSTDTSKALESIASIKVKSVSLPELSDLEAQHAEPFISVNISEDKMAASILVIPGFQRILPTVEEIKQALAEAKVVYGIDEDAIEQIIREQKIFLEVPVAFGKKPLLPTDASVEFLFPASGFVIEEPGENEMVDPASFYKIFTCKSGDVLAVKKEAVSGQDGVTVTGEVIKVERPKDLNLAAFVGENVTLSTDGTKIIASCDGQPYLKDSKVNVRNVLVIDKDLGYDTGNIDFNASVIIRGNAEGPFKIKAKGDVLIMGVLGEVHVSCTGSLRVQGGVFGRGKGVIEVGKEFTTKFLNEAQVFCDGDLLVEDYIMNSTVVCNGNVKVFGKGVVIGGVVKAAGKIELSEAGSVAAVRTELSAGIDYDYEARYIKLQQSLLEILNQLSKLSAAENSLRAQLIQTKDPVKRESIRTIMQKIQTVKHTFEKQLYKVRNALKILRVNVSSEKLRLNATIKVRRICHPNVRIGIGLSSKLNTDRVGPCEFFLNKATGNIECR